MRREFHRYGNGWMLSLGFAQLTVILGRPALYLVHRRIFDLRPAPEPEEANGG